MRRFLVRRSATSATANTILSRGFASASKLWRSRIIDEEFLKKLAAEDPDYTTAAVDAQKLRDNRVGTLAAWKELYEDEKKALKLDPNVRAWIQRNLKEEEWAEKRKLEERSPFFEEDSQGWPTPADPSLPLQTSVQQLSFIETKDSDGAWCFEPDNRCRMVRNREYPRLWAAFTSLFNRSGHQGLLVTGHPGIGKSLLLDVLLAWCLFSFSTGPVPVPVLVISAAKTTLFTNIQGSAKKRYWVRTATDFNMNAELIGKGILQGSRIIVLHDLKTSDVLSYRGALIDLLREQFIVKCVVSSSPQESNYKDFMKITPPPTKHVLPVLSMDEAKEFCLKIDPAMNDDTFRDYYEKVGGVPRHLQSSLAVKMAVENQTLAAPNLNFRVGIEPESMLGRESSKLVMPVPNAARNKIEIYDFVSSGARHAWFEAKKTSEIEVQLDRLHDAKGQTRDALGRVFEAWILMSIRGGTTMCRRKMTSTGTVGSMERWSIPSPLAATEFPGNDPSRITQVKQPTIFVPQSSNFPVVDAVIVEADHTATLIQVTVADKHASKYSEVDTLLNALKANGLTLNAFVWVVDESSGLHTTPSVASSTGQPCNAYNNMAHYLCRHGNMMCWVRRKGTPNHSSLGFPVSSVALSSNQILTEIHKWVDPNAKSLTNYKGTTDSTPDWPLIFKC